MGDRKMEERKMGGRGYIFLSVIFLSARSSRHHLLFYPRWQGFCKGCGARQPAAAPGGPGGGLASRRAFGYPDVVGPSAAGLRAARRTHGEPPG